MVTKIQIPDKFPANRSSTPHVKIETDRSIEVSPLFKDRPEPEGRQVISGSVSIPLTLKGVKSPAEFSSFLRSVQAVNKQYHEESSYLSFIQFLKS